MIYKIVGNAKTDIRISEEISSSGRIIFKGIFADKFFISNCIYEKYYICLKAVLSRVKDYAEENDLTVGIAYGVGQLYGDRKRAKEIIGDVFAESSVKCYVYKELGGD